jgi:hypothetical protein
VGSTFIPTIRTGLLVPYSGALNWVHVTATRTILSTLRDAVTHNKEVCQYSVNESSEGGLRIRIGTGYAGHSFCDAA